MYVDSNRYRVRWHVTWMILPNDHYWLLRFDRILLANLI
jgi:hypothetical protein